MAEVLRIWDASGNLLFDSPTAVGGVPIALHSIAAGVGTVVYSWPGLPGRSIVVLPIVFADYVDAAIDYALGYPRLTYTKRAAASDSLVMLL